MEKLAPTEYSTRYGQMGRHIPGEGKLYLGLKWLMKMEVSNQQMS